MFADVKPAMEEEKIHDGVPYISRCVLPYIIMLFDDEAKTKYVTDLQMSR